MRRFAFLPLVLLAAVPPFVDVLIAQDRPPKAGKKYAVLVGVNKYTKPRFEALQFAEKDMRDLKAELEAAGFAVTLLLGSAEGDGEATVENIRKVLIDKAGVLKTVTQDDTVLVAFSGHGEQIAIKVGEKETEAPFFCPKHAVSGDPDTQANINDVLDALDKRGAGSNLVLVDACRKYAARVPGTKSGASMDRAKVQSLRDGIGVMFACADRQTALENAKAGDGHGLFFCAVLDALKEAKQPGKAVTWERLVPEIRTKVVALTDELAKTLPKDERQRPQYIGNFTRDPVLIAAAAAPPTKERAGGDEVEFAIADGVKMTFCWIPPGEAQLGSPKAERDAVMKNGDYKEEPDWLKAEAEEVRGQYKEKTGFWLGKYVVTQAEWTAVMRKTPFYFHKDGDGKKDVAGLDTSRFPAEQVSWNDAQAFLTRVNGRSGVEKVFGKGAKLMLPHEDRWEYAYRGKLGNGRAYYWGDSLNGAKANCEGNYPFGTTEKGPWVEQPTVVGSYALKAPHPWGLCDMSGNVWQWCENKYSEHSSDSGLVVVRGGSWDNFALRCRAALRTRIVTSHLNNNVGFRVCVVLD